MLSFLFHHTTYFLLSILTYFVTTKLNHLQCVYNGIIKKIPISHRLLLLKIANLTLFSVGFFYKIYSHSVMNNGENPGPKYLSLSFCHWNLNELTAHDCIKITLIQGYITNQNCDVISCQKLS